MRAQLRTRPYQHGDAAGLVAIYRQSVLAIGPRDYSARQVEAWASLTPTLGEMVEHCEDGRQVIIAVKDDDAPVAFGDVEADGHIGYLYCAPDMIGNGAAAQVYEALEKAAQNAGITRLYVEASEAARRFLITRGFSVLGKREVAIGEVTIHNFAMEKTSFSNSGATVGSA